MTPLVNEFLEFWTPGVWFSRTENYPEGCLIICALLLIICDLVAARKTAGFASFHHEHFCSVCYCCRSEKGYNRTDYHNWQRRTNEECRAAAERFRDAADETTKQRSFDSTGLQWSELLRLPYFDITRSLVVDSMHNLFLGLLKEHFNNILGIGLREQQEKPVVTLLDDLDNHNLTGNDRKGVQQLRKLLQSPITTTLPSRAQAIKKLTSNVTSSALRLVCNLLECIPAFENADKLTKAHLAGYLYEWVSVQLRLIGLCLIST